MKIKQKIVETRIFYSILFLCFLVSFFLNYQFSLNPDSSWLITVGEELLKGKVYGKDILESNPPASVLIYFPGIFFAKLFNISSESGVSLSLYCLTFFVCLILRNYLNRVNQPKLPYFYILIATLPALISCLYFQLYFSQREHFSFLFAFPYIVLSAFKLSQKRHFTSENIPVSMRLIAGIGIGITVSIKPVYALVPLFLCLNELIINRNFKSLFSIENWASIVTFIIYLLSVFLFFPEYISFFQSFLSDAYFSRTLSWNETFYSGGFLYVIIFVFYILVSLFFKQSQLQKSFFLASFGFYLAFLIQRKGYLYQAYPAFITIYMASILLCEQIIIKPFNNPLLKVLKYPLIAMTVYILASTATQMFSSWNITGRQLDAEHYIQKLKTSPKMLSLGGSIGVAFPLSRKVNAEWVGATHSVFTITHLSEDLQTQLFDGDYDAPFLSKDIKIIQILTKNIRDNNPDIIVIEDHPKWKKFLLSKPYVQQALQDYRLAKTLNFIEIWVREDIKIPNEVE